VGLLHDPLTHLASSPHRRPVALSHLGVGGPIRTTQAGTCTLPLFNGLIVNALNPGGFHPHGGQDSGDLDDEIVKLAQTALEHI
jgi:hypothetical protein